jgi:hypothetical protein
MTFTFGAYHVTSRMEIGEILGLAPTAFTTSILEMALPLIPTTASFLCLQFLTVGTLGRFRIVNFR